MNSPCPNCGVVLDADYDHDREESATLRDQFAMAAPIPAEIDTVHFGGIHARAKVDAKWRYIHADAMLAARAVTQVDDESDAA